MSREIARCRPTFQVPADAILMSGAKPFKLSDRFGRTGIGYDGVVGNGALYNRFVSRSRTGHDSPGPRRPVLSSRVRLRVLPAFPPNRSVKTPIPCRS